MASMVLNSPQAVRMSVFVVKAFIAMRSLLVTQQGLAKKLAELERSLTERLDTHEHAITDIIHRRTLECDESIVPRIICSEGFV